MTNIEITRVLGQVVTGIGFIGAGTIIHYRTPVKGLTAAATSSAAVEMHEKFSKLPIMVRIIMVNPGLAIGIIS